MEKKVELSIKSGNVKTASELIGSSRYVSLRSDYANVWERSYTIS